jgi:beta-glucanase (GH16 family)
LSQAQATLVWSDEFDTPGLPDPTKWNYDVGGGGWGNNELQYYTEADLDNARVEDGILIIEARNETSPVNVWGRSREYTSARLTSKSKGDWQYGRFEIRAKLPAGRGTWPAIWMLSTGNAYGGWPESGEIDIMEHVGFDMDTIHGSLHNNNRFGGAAVTDSLVVDDVDTTFHVYALEWYPDEIRFFVDDILYHTAVNPQVGWEGWPYIHPFHLILNIAVGGDWGGLQGIDPDIWPQRMEIDYVRVYDLGDSPVLDADGDTLIDALDPDDDNDGLSDLEELGYGTNPHKADTDGDGFTDKEEIEAGSLPDNPGATPEALLGALSNEDFFADVDSWRQAITTFSGSGEITADVRFRGEQVDFDSLADGVATFSQTGSRSGTVHNLIFQRIALDGLEPGDRVIFQGMASASGNGVAEAVIEAGSEATVSFPLGAESGAFSLTTILQKGDIRRIRIGFQIRAASGESGSISFSNLSATIEPAVSFAGYTSLDGQWIDTGDWLGWLYIADAPYLRSTQLEQWIYLPEENVSESGAWGFFFK